MIKKLSELSNEIELCVEESSIIYTVAELKREILELGEPHHETDTWFIIKKKKWKPDVVRMVEQYIENEYDDMYEDWDERAMECMTDEHLNKIQEILNEAFKGEDATVYWSYEESVEIDIFPSEE